MTTLTFQNTTLSVINQHNQTYITASDLGLALEYTQPVVAISKIYDRNADEFTAEMTALIEMPTAGGIQKVRIFSLRGAHLIAMFARTKVAKAFRKWVLDILDKEIKQQSLQRKPRKQRGLPAMNPFNCKTYEREFTARELEWLVLIWHKAYQYRELLQQLLPILEVSRSAYFESVKRLVDNADFDFDLSATVLYRITRQADVMELAPLITLEKYVH